MAELIGCEECGLTVQRREALTWLRIGRVDGGAHGALSGDYCSLRCVAAAAAKEVGRDAEFEAFWAPRPAVAS